MKYYILSIRIFTTIIYKAENRFYCHNINGLKDAFLKVKGRLQAWQSSALSNTETLPKTWSVNAVFVLVNGVFCLFLAIQKYQNVELWKCVNQFLYSNCSSVGGPESSPGQSPFPSSTDLKPQWRSRQVLQWSCTQQSSVWLCQYKSRGR